MSEASIELKNVSKRFGRKEVLRSISLCVPQGKIYALLGRNGAGKTTTINILMGLLKPSGGDLSVLGLNPLKDGLEVRRRVGFMAEDAAMFGWMTVREIARFLAPFYPTWDSDLAEACMDRFGLQKDEKIKNLSKGQSMRLSMLLALAHRPELIVLDDPTLGLDPIARKEFLRDVIEELQTRGSTVFYTSHLLYEIEQVADIVAILHEGRIVCESSTDALRERVKRLIIPKKWAVNPDDLGSPLDIRDDGNYLSVVVDDFERVISRLNEKTLQPEAIDMNLDEIFEAYVIGRRSIENDSTDSLERVA